MNLKQNINNYQDGLSYICNVSRVNCSAWCVQSLGLKIWNTRRNRNLKHYLSHLSLCFSLSQIRERFYSLCGISCLLWSYSANQNIKKKKKAAFMCPTHFNPMDCSSPVLHCLRGVPQTHVHWVSDTIQPSHPLSPSSPPAINLSQHQDLFQWVISSHQVAKVLEFQFQHQSFQWIPRTYLL